MTIRRKQIRRMAQGGPGLGVSPRSRAQFENTETSGLGAQFEGVRRLGQGWRQKSPKSGTLEK